MHVRPTRGSAVEARPATSCLSTHTHEFQGHLTIQRRFAIMAWHLENAKPFVCYDSRNIPHASVQPVGHELPEAVRLGGLPAAQHGGA